VVPTRPQTIAHGHERGDKPHKNAQQDEPDTIGSISAPQLGIAFRRAARNRECDTQNSLIILPEAAAVRGPSGPHDDGKSKSLRHWAFEDQSVFGHQVFQSL
jgi:hypothetical protein